LGGTTSRATKGTDPFTGFGTPSRDLRADLGNQAGTVTFAIGLADNSSASLTSGTIQKDLLYDNILVEGSVVPEPATLGLVLIGLLATLRSKARTV
jgi:hypothetical protein